MANENFKQALDRLDAGAAESPPPAPGTPPPPREVPAHPAVEGLRARFGDEAVLRHEVVAGDEHVVFVAAERIAELLGFLKDDPAQGYDYLKDITAVDYGNGVYLQVVYQIWSMAHKRELRVKAELPLDGLEIDTAYYLWRAADWLEREVYDMFGVVFRGHPDLRRILMPFNYAEGHPLRKDFPLRGRFSRAEQTRRALSMKTEDFYSPYELEVARRLGQPLPAPLGDAGGLGVPTVGEMPGVGGSGGGVQ
ncbi:MAG TPA: NADH-quinone oxidoreductase subunit C [Longimicrobiaceae bacterium]|jgi:NADH-quinone oxidoreductase subunit C|nr:NADH-quinone oxidoreductase subunit C [Longimicrobiaceae bacterium]